VVLDVATQAELLGHMTAAALNFDDAPLALENLSLLRIRPGMRAGAIYDAGGRLFASYAVPGEPAIFPPRAQPEGSRAEGERFVMFHRIVEHGDFIGTVYLRSEYALMARLLDYLLIGSAAMLLALAVAVLVARRIGRVITGPVLRITGIAREVVATRDFSRRAPRSSDDEVAELVDSFNAMLREIELRTGELDRLNEQLEQRVYERTLQLETANAELELAMAEAQKANQAKSAFLSSMSHELRTPLNAILGFAQILTSDSMPATPEQRKEFAGHIHKSGRHLLTLINEILDLAKVESGTVSLALEPVDMAGAIAECRAMVEPLAARRGVRLLFPDSCGSSAYADRTRVKQVLLNLLSNAIKYNREGGAVMLDCRRSGASAVRVSVQDTGIGLSRQQLDNLFQPFNRLGQEAGTEEGSGIGLVVTRRLVELMGGTVGVSSTAGVGSVFWFELPLAVTEEAVEAPQEQEGQAAPSDAAVSHTLLYVEDNPANLDLVAQLLRYRPGMRLLAAPDGRTGVEMARRHRPDLVLMDLNLPDMSGIEAFHALRALPETAQVPVIALTANAMAGDAERGRAAGFFRYLSKPIDIDEFNASVDAALALRQEAAHP
jgi:signal transduction histidine kinase/CheY-like chemotaxis protein